MKKEFPGFYPLSDSEKESFWENAIIVLDTAFLLDLFRLKSESSNIVFSILENSNIKDKLWIPYDVAWLYHQSVNNEILIQIENIQTALRNLTSCKEAIIGKKCFPYFDNSIIERLNCLSHIISRKSAEQINILSNSLSTDEKKERINELFKETENNKKIGESYGEAELNEIYLLSQKRYSDLIPPGYSAEAHSQQRVMYHDMIVWKQLQKHAKDTHKDIIMIMGHNRKDWFYIVNGNVISPRHEIINEFAKETEQKFYCLTSYDFIKKCSVRYGIEITDDLLEELAANAGTSSSFNSQVSINRSENSTC